MTNEEVNEVVISKFPYLRFKVLVALREAIRENPLPCDETHDRLVVELDLELERRTEVISV